MDNLLRAHGEGGRKFLIVGGVGAGKTWLMDAFALRLTEEGRRIQRTSPEQEVWHGRSVEAVISDFSASGGLILIVDNAEEDTDFVAAMFKAWTFARRVLLVACWPETRLALHGAVRVDLPTPTRGAIATILRARHFSPRFVVDGDIQASIIAAESGFRRGDMDKGCLSSNLIHRLHCASTGVDAPGRDILSTFDVMLGAVMDKPEQFWEEDFQDRMGHMAEMAAAHTTHTEAWREAPMHTANMERSADLAYSRLFEIFPWLERKAMADHPLYVDLVYARVVSVFKRGTQFKGKKRMVPHRLSDKTRRVTLALCGEAANVARLTRVAEEGAMVHTLDARWKRVLCSHAASIQLAAPLPPAGNDENEEPVIGVEEAPPALSPAAFMQRFRRLK